MLRLLSSAARVAEVGVFRGEFSQKLMEFLHPDELVLVDKWELNKSAMFRENITPRHMKDVSAAFSAYFQGDPEEVFRQAFEAVVNWSRDNPKVRILRKDSVLAARDFPDGYFDVIYVDASHFYESVLADLYEWGTKLKRGGLLICNDFYESAIGARQNLGVIPAVSTFMKRQGFVPVAVSAMPFSDAYLTNDPQSEQVRSFTSAIIVSAFPKVKLPSEALLAFHHDIHVVDGKQIKVPSLSLQ